MLFTVWDRHLSADHLAISDGRHSECAPRSRLMNCLCGSLDFFRNVINMYVTFFAARFINKRLSKRIETSSHGVCRELCQNDPRGFEPYLMSP